MRPLAFVIHDLNPWGGHDRSTLEVVRRLSHHWPVDVYAYSLVDPEGAGRWGKVRFHRIAPNLHRPVAARLAWFYGATLPPLRIFPALRRGPRPLIHATGTCSLVSDVVQVQFVSSAWEKRQAQLPEDVCARPFLRGKSGPAAWARKSYHNLLLSHNVASERRVYTKDKTYIAIARSVAEELREHFGIKDRVHVIHHGVDSTQFRPAETPEERDSRERIRAEAGVGEDELMILFVGAYERKGLAVAIDALAKLSPEARRKAKLVAVGGGAAAGFEARAREFGVGDQVRLLGHRKEIPEFYRAADIFVLPTLYEPFGLVIIEALASGLPSVISRLAGASELVTDGVSASLIENPESADEVARRLERLLLDPTLRLSMGRAARQVAEARSWDRVADEYAAALDPLLKSGG